MNSSFLLLTLPQDVVLHIFNDWLSSFEDFISFDKALTHKASRDLFFGLMSSLRTSNNGSIQFDHTVPIKIPKSQHIESVSNWEKKRGIYLRNVWIPKIGKVDNHFIIKSGGLTSVRTLMLVGEWRITFAFNFFSFFGNHLPCLESLTLRSCRILIVNPQVLNENSNILAPATKIKQLALHYVFSMDLPGDDFENNGSALSGRRSSSAAIPKDECWKVYLKIAQFCPKLQDLTIEHCYGGTSANVIPMIRALPELTKYRYVAGSDNRPALDDNQQSVMAATIPFPPPSKLSSFSVTHLMSNNIDEELDVMFACCDGRHLRHVDVVITYVSQSHRQRLMNFIEQHWINLQTLTIKICVIPCLSVCLRVCQQLQELKLSFVHNETIDETTFAALTVPNALPHLRSLSFESCKLTDEAIITLCSSTVAQQLTSLKIWNCYEFHFHSLQLVARSFPHLEHFYLDCRKGIQQIGFREAYQEVAELLDVLFSEECAFANTIQTLEVNILFDFVDPIEPQQNETLEEELYNDHMVPHWTFPFPQLRSFSFDWRVNHDKMSQLIKQRVLGGHHPHLHSIKLVTHQVVDGEETVYNLELKDRSEVIRQLREKVNEEA